jgi:hypothetical protein
MRIETYITVRTAALALGIAAAITALGWAAVGHAQDVPAAASTVQTQSAHHAEFLGALKGGAIGCLAGGILGKLTHHSVLKSCAVGGATGAVIGGVRAYREQMREAQALAEQARAAGATADIQTRDVRAQSEDGGTENTAALKTMTLHLDEQGVAGRTADTRSILARAAALAAQSKTPVTLSVTGSSADRDWIAQQLRAGVGDASNVRIDESYSASPTLQINMQQS